MYCFVSKFGHASKFGQKATTQFQTSLKLTPECFFIETFFKDVSFDVKTYILDVLMHLVWLSSRQNRCLKEMILNIVFSVLVFEIF